MMGSPVMISKDERLANCETTIRRLNLEGLAKDRRIELLEGIAYRQGNKIKAQEVENNRLRAKVKTAAVDLVFGDYELGEM